ncbi:DeoR/GlpR family DNA-binding transcription regulator [Aerococcus sanguinicola]|uniref:DeoR/GlpR family DNA-binding transcription regulator n=1 Tax=unclassified Aerococcus TaxID=2618060 RepID=UPI0008A5BF3D|nr:MULTISPECIES: DeoR/GlpR family DNA-binding transcription regulator [unclassified Aerococcus]KAB0645762.1 DeoR/GlpR transcriptional regulator [Aerococcus sanguinicola]MDK6234326.1 DeoR/GlpR family DNA-binding transcription regulator [Aerococcus sp. UMB10185]MDK6856431.1 DeoR/GlpR family DNA-binding transcription regulator [Aerococcus sp. UMB7533]OFN01193.1 DeoR family transcriptional regulator [Aerococcus sp. HMSC062A02]OHO44335.1 DeoR family transcriptional regulator [Aerococcus sp. HMSC035
MSRQEDIIALVNQEKKVPVNSLAEKLGVSSVTIRKDLDKLEERGILHREHGYAVINNSDDINFRLAQNYNLKRLIAQSAAEAIQDDDMIMIESGSTCTLLAEEIARSNKQVTIITNSCFIASYIRKYPSVRIILLGGEYQKDSQVNIGPLVEQNVNNFFVDKFFVGIDGFDKEKGFMGTDIERSQTANTMRQIARETIILTDSSKFQQRGRVAEFDLSDIAMIYTDKGISEESKAYFNSHQIEVVTA